MKLCKEHKTWAKLAYADAIEQDVVIHINYEHRFVVAYQRAFKGSKMIAASVSHMDENEETKFRKWTGIYFALQRLSDGEYVQLPVGKLWDDKLALVELIDKTFTFDI